MLWRGNKGFATRVVLVICVSIMKRQRVCYIIYPTYQLFVKVRSLLIVDIISSFLTDPLNMDELGIDVCITSSQKGLNIVPGLSFVILSERMLHQEFVHKRILS